MDTVRRYQAAFTGGSLDRVPVCGWLSLPLLAQLLGTTPVGALRRIVEEPIQVVALQERMGLDPILVTIDDRWFSQHHYWRMLCGYPDEALETWHVHQEVTGRSGGFTSYRFVATTPEGPVTWGYRVGGNVLSEEERPLKHERDLELLSRYLPAPEHLDLSKLRRMVERVGNRAFFTHNFVGVWGEAANLRGLNTLLMDLKDCPGLVRRLSEVLTERAIRKVRHLAQTGVHSILYDQSWVGIGLSAATYREFILPYDRQVIAAARDVGLLVSYHNCGKGMRFLEEMVSTGPDALETLTPRESAGDFDLAEVKRRVGERVTLNGGFNERILATGTAQEVQAEVWRCLDAAAAGGRYVLRACGQITALRPGNLEAWVEAARAYGHY